MKDFIEKTMREKGREPGYMDYTRGHPPSQLITEELLTELQKMGKKKGGAVKKADGGSVNYNTSPDMSDGGRLIQGNPFKRGGKVKMTSSRDTMLLELSKLKRK
jgi:hypothetical protein